MARRNSPGLSHVDETGGGVRMVDVGAKDVTRRVARAQATVRVGSAVARLVRATGGVSKGPVLETARLAGVMGAKKAPDLVPLSHPIALDWIDVTARVAGDAIEIEATVACTGRTGVEVEAMTAAATAALAVYDMCKSAGKGIEIESVRLVEKSGGKSGHWKRSPDAYGAGRPGNPRRRGEP